MIAAVARAELGQRRRSLRSRLGVGVCLVLGAGAGWADVLLEPADEVHRTASLALAGLVQIMPFLAAVMGVIVAGDGQDPRSRAATLAILVSSPISNAGYQMRRGVVLAAMTAAASALPFLVCGAGVGAMGLPGFSLADWVGAWATLVLPRALLVTVGWLGVTTIFPTEISGFLAIGLVAGLGEGLANEALARFRFTFYGWDGFFGWKEMQQWLGYLSWRLGRWMQWGRAVSVPATSAPWELQLAWSTWAPIFRLPGAFAMAFWGISCVFLGRVRRDVEPRPVRKGHPAPTVMAQWNRFRQERAPDAGLCRADVFLVAMSGVFVVGAFGWVGRGHSLWTSVAQTRLEVELSGGPAPNPLGLIALEWRVEGKLERDGSLEVEHRTTWENRTAEALGRVALELDEWLEVGDLRVAGRELALQRRGDRIEVQLDPPLAPGESVEVELEVSGRPIRPDFRLLRGRSASFVTAWQGSFADLSKTVPVPVLSRRGGTLVARHLAPRLRYTTWELTPPPSSPGERGRYVLAEEAGRPLELRVRLEHPPEWILADSCGTVSFSTVSSGTAFEGICRTGLGEWRLVGGPRVLVEHGRVRMLVLPEHVEAASNQEAALERADDLVRRAWPGLGGLENFVLYEATPRPSLQLRDEMIWHYLDDPKLIRAAGRLLFFDEWRLVLRAPFDAEPMATGVLIESLIARRPVRAEEDHLVRGFLRATILLSMGAESARTAVSSIESFKVEEFRKPLFEAEAWDRRTFDHRLPALVADLEARLGRQTLRAGVEVFLSGGEREGGEIGQREEGTVRELIDAFAAAGERDLSRFWDDFVEGSALPVLSWGEVDVEQRDDGSWWVTGRLENEGDGEVFCPIVIETEAGDRIETLRVDGERGVSFALGIPARPHSVVLDPRETCHRWRGPAAAAAERRDLLQGRGP